MVFQRIHGVLPSAQDLYNYKTIMRNAIKNKPFEDMTKFKYEETINNLKRISKLAVYDYITKSKYLKENTDFLFLSNWFYQRRQIPHETSCAFHYRTPNQLSQSSNNETKVTRLTKIIENIKQLDIKIWISNGSPYIWVLSFSNNYGIFLIIY